VGTDSFGRFTAEFARQRRRRRTKGDRPGNDIIVRSPTWKVTAFIAIFLIAAPALAASASSATPNMEATPAPSPPAVTYDVWGFKWNGAQWVKQSNYTFQTTDLERALDYQRRINGYPGWTATTNVPTASNPRRFFRGSVVANTGPTELPSKPMYSVWAFRLADGKWVKDDRQSWTTTDPQLGIAYARKVNAVAGWTATTNCPPPVERALRYVNGGMTHSAENSSVRFSIGGWSITVPYTAIKNGANANGGSESYSPDSSPTYDNTSDVQNMINTQNMINNQVNNDNTQNMINLQNMINTQNMIDAQNAINAANP
jgi:hypothetical protein